MSTSLSFPGQLDDYWDITQDKLKTEFEFRGYDWSQLFDALSLEQQRDVKKVCTISQFVADNIAIDGELFFQQVISNDIYQSLSQKQLERNLLALISDPSSKVQSNEVLPSEEQLFKALRIFRRRTQIHIIWHDLLRLAKTMNTTRMLSDMADVCITQGLNYVHAILAEKHGEPIGKTTKIKQ